tara:strand:- start:2166 stop:3224 length:1059 start_codon:yes stop_codon:yes gene_type:complete
MDLTAKELYDQYGKEGVLLELKGNLKVKIENIAGFSNGNKGDLIFVPDEKALEIAIKGNCSAMVIDKKLAELSSKISNEIAIFISANIALSHAKIKLKYSDHDYGQSGWERIHSSSVIHQSVEIPSSTTIGPNVVIEKGAIIGENCKIMANVVIEHNAILGNNVRIHPSTIIGWDCKIGNDCLILSNSVIGSEGFGYSQDQFFNHHRIPQTGNVVIGNKVTIGANNTIDRGTYGPTTIGEGTIFDNICHTAHNVTIGKNCIILSGWLCAGSTTIGDRVVASGGAIIRDHISICDDVYLVHRAGVLFDIKEKGMYAGTPTLKMQDYKENLKIAQNLKSLATDIERLKKLKQLK